MVSVKSFMKVFQAFVCLITLSSAPAVTRGCGGMLSPKIKFYIILNTPGLIRAGVIFVICAI